MKMSVIFGVSQMCLGILMKAFNAIHFGRKLDFYFEFIPQIILMLCLFGWMDVLIIVKWLTPWEGNSSRAPGIVSIMINMFLSGGAINTDVNDAIVSSPGTQQAICIILLILALICIPSMLLIKPYILYKEMKDHENSSSSNSYVELLDKNSEEEGKEEEFNPATNEIRHDINITQILDEGTVHESHGIGEIFIHQLIETIEFALGTVSNTASYLRLWALSLAHGQLADVFFEKLLKTMALSGSGSSVLLFLLFPIFASFSFFVLLCMDSMECFLHTLRLHWVEFQNKFYKGNGYRFVPVSFRVQIEQEINNSYTENIIIDETDDENVEDSDTSIQELQPTIDQIKKKKEEDKKDDPNSGDKNKVYNELRKLQDKLDVESLRDARERLEKLRRTLQTNKDILNMVNIIEIDPEDLYHSKVNFDTSLGTLTNSQREIDTEISDAERLITQVENLVKDRKELDNYSVTQLEGMVARCKEVSTTVRSIHQGLDTQSEEQGGRIARLERFLEDAKIEQIKRCDLEDNTQSAKTLDEKVNFCHNILTNIKNIADHQKEEGSESHKQAVRDFKEKIQDWDARFGKCENSNSSLFREIEAIKDKTNEQSKTLLNMNNIRDILGSKEQNFQKLKLEIEDIERLINELKIAELKWTEFEEKEKVQRALLDELWPKIDTLKEKHEEFFLQYEVASTNLKPLLNILNLMKDHEDYSEDQEFV